eukprot:3571874-Pleurochrysis_carterae.AAC.4
MRALGCCVRSSQLYRADWVLRSEEAAAACVFGRRGAAGGPGGAPVQAESAGDAHARRRRR